MLNTWLEKNFKRVIEIRRWLHKHPEVGFEEYKTSEYCRKFMVCKVVNLLPSVLNISTSGI